MAPVSSSNNLVGNVAGGGGGDDGGEPHDGAARRPVKPEVEWAKLYIYFDETTAGALQGGAFVELRLVFKNNDEKGGAHVVWAGTFVMAVTSRPTWALPPSAYLTAP